MAITATVALSDATVTAEMATTATVTVSNSGAASVNVLSVTPTAPIDGLTARTTAVALGAVPLGPGSTVAVAASGTLDLSFPVVAHAPTTDTSNPATPSSLVYSIGATIYTSDGAITVATPTTLTVTNPAGL
jgi:hypothetical protein